MYEQMSIELSIETLEEVEISLERINESQGIANAIQKIKEAKNELLMLIPSDGPKE